jgi:hypothetical protein
MSATGAQLTFAALPLITGPEGPRAIRRSDALLGRINGNREEKGGAVRDRLGCILSLEAGQSCAEGISRVRR